MKKTGLSVAFIIIILVYLVGPAGFAAGKQVYRLCRNKDTVRTLRVCYDRKTGDYRLIYTKNGKDEYKAAGKSFDFVVSKLESIQENLEKSKNWDCKDVTPSTHFHQRTVATDAAENSPVEPEDCE